MKKGGKCIIVSAGDVSADILPEKESKDFLIAADAGLKFLIESGITPDAFIGDGDSLGYIPELGDVTVLPSVKNDTDTVAAVKLGFERGYSRFELYGALGGKRFSHSVANVQTLAYIDGRGGDGVIVDKSCTCRILSAENVNEISFAQRTGYFSMFALGAEAVVSVSGAKYEVNCQTLSPSFPLGVSNESEGECRVSVREGKVLFVSEPECDEKVNFHINCIRA